MSFVEINEGMFILQSSMYAFEIEDNDNLMDIHNITVRVHVRPYVAALCRLKLPSFFPIPFHVESNIEREEEIRIYKNVIEFLIEPRESTILYENLMDVIYQEVLYVCGSHWESTGTHPLPGLDSSYRLHLNNVQKTIYRDFSDRY